MKHRIVAIHQYDDYSGSPKVLAGNLSDLQAQGYEVIIHTSATAGPLSALADTKQHLFDYAPSANKLCQLWKYLRIQVLLFVRLIHTLQHTDIVYINTLLPFGAAIAARYRGCRIIYHLHETSVRPVILKRFLKLVAKQTASKLVYVSAFLQENETIDSNKSCVIPNCLPIEFTAVADDHQVAPYATKFTCLMACSLREYKGVRQFISVASKLPKVKFELVLNAAQEEISNYFQADSLPDNLIVFPRQKDMHWFYQRAHLVLNLSLPDQWVETFGMTLLEGMYYGRPVIGPEIGGPTEIVEHRRTGFLTNAYHLEVLCTQIRTLCNSPATYAKFAGNAKERSTLFSQDETKKMWSSLMEDLHGCSITPLPLSAT